MTTGHELLLGAHMPITGGLSKAVERIMALGGTALQIFSRNQRQWKIPELTDEDIERFKDSCARWGNYPVANHDSYLINLANPAQDKAEKSVQAFAVEMQRTEALSIPWMVTHPGSHLGQGKEQGIVTYVRNLDRAIELSGTQDMTVLLENTAGQGTNLGSSFDELAAMISTSRYPDRLGVCYDTCHGFAAGYDIRTPQTYQATMDALDHAVGLDRVHFFHLNDSKHDLGAHKDRHEHIGKGYIGEQGFGLLLRDARFAHVGKCIETPKDKDLKDDVVNLNVLRALYAA